MTEKNKKRKKRKAPRQNWKPHWLASLLYRMWMILFSAAKVAVGALATVLLIVVVCGFVFVGLLGAYLQDDIIPQSEFLLDNLDLDETSYIMCVDSDGNIQQQQRIYATTDRQWVAYEDIPQDLINAAIAIEDKRFYEHQGVDWITTIKACAGMFFGTGDAGGSTITQQLVKNITGDDDVTVQRKVVEIFKAQQCEQRYDKETIMEWYLNIIYFGKPAGVKSAAAYYFGKELQSLTTAECASLISITNNPSLFSPYGNEFEYKGEMTTGADRNRIRQVNTLWMMRNEGYLTEEEYQAALAQEMVFKNGIDDADKMAYCENETCGYKGIVKTLVHDEETNDYYCPKCGSVVLANEDVSEEVYSWFVDEVLDNVAEAFAAEDGIVWAAADKDTKDLYKQIIQRGGFYIYSTIDLDVQAQVDKIYSDLTQVPATKNSQQLQSGIVVIDNRTGDVVAMAGGVGNKSDYGFDAYNRATDAKLQVGSSLKPLTVYAPAFELGVITPATVVQDLPYQYNNGVAWPKNDPAYYAYSRTVLNGIVNSVNAIAINTLDTIGTRYSYNFAKEYFGISDLTNYYVSASGSVLSDENLSPLGMGALTVGATVRDMANAYSTFANDGVYREARTFTKVYDSQGNLVLDNTQESRQILSLKTVNYINYCLDYAVDHGTGSAMDFDGMDICGKTGTTSALKDRYFCGYTDYYTAAVWTGFDIPEVIRLTGDYSNPAGRLWKKVMQPIHEGLERVPMYSTENMVQVTVCLDSGKLVTDACTADVRGVSRTNTVWVYEDDLPQEYCDKHILLDYCVTGNAVANEYCKKFADIGAILLQDRALVKLTAKQIEALDLAEEFSLESKYVRDDYIYQINAVGNPVAFFGIHGDLTNPDGHPCITCTVHTKQSWDAYKAENPWVDGGVTVPTEPQIPTEPEPSAPDATEPAPTETTPTEPGPGNENFE